MRTSSTCASASRRPGRHPRDWRKCEAKLNALPQFITKIAGLDIHFIHVRSKHPNALPLIITHGWPGSIIEEVERVLGLAAMYGWVCQRIDDLQLAAWILDHDIRSYELITRVFDGQPEGLTAPPKIKPKEIQL
jgi:Epoxide hydrolase N terminus